MSVDNARLSFLDAADRSSVSGKTKVLQIKCCCVVLDVSQCGDLFKAILVAELLDIELYEIQGVFQLLLHPNVLCYNYMCGNMM